MKTKKQSAIILLSIIIFGLISCEKDKKIDINLLVGEWYVYNDNPNLSVDSYVTYTFCSDKICSIRSRDCLSDRDTTIARTYVISYDNTLITLSDEKNKYTEQYHIRKLTSKEMVWENVVRCNGNSNKKLRKINFAD